MYLNHRFIDHYSLLFFSLIKFSSSSSKTSSHTTYATRTQVTSRSRVESSSKLIVIYHFSNKSTDMDTLLSKLECYSLIQFKIYDISLYWIVWIVPSRNVIRILVCRRAKIGIRKYWNEGGRRNVKNPGLKRVSCGREEISGKQQPVPSTRRFIGDVLHAASIPCNERVEPVQIDLSTAK